MGADIRNVAPRRRGQDEAVRDASETPDTRITVPQRERWVSWLLPIGLIIGLAVLLSLPLGQTPPEAGTHTPVELWLKSIVGYLAAGAEIAAALVIGVAIVRALISYVYRGLFRFGADLDWSEAIRLQLGRVLALGLEFTVASDILRTAVAPTRQDIVNLGAIVLLRTLLNYFLEREIAQGEARRRAQSSAA